MMSVIPQVMPGLLLCFVLRYDAYKRSQTVSTECGLPPPVTVYHKITYFHCSLIGYFLGKPASNGLFSLAVHLLAILFVS